MKIPESKELLKIYSHSIEKFVSNLENYLETDNKVSRLKYKICGKKIELFGILLDTYEDKNLLLRRLRRVKKQIITFCLELLDITFDEEIISLMRTISNKRHTWKIVKDKNLNYSWDFIESVFDYY